MNTTPITVYEGNTTTVTLDVGQGLVGVGVARCRQDDVFSKQIGQIIAAGRAIQDIGRQVEDNGNASVVTIEELDRVLRLIDAVADEEGSTSMPVGSTTDAQIEERQAAEDDELVNQFMGMLIGKDLQASAEKAAEDGRCDDPNCICQ